MILTGDELTEITSVIDALNESAGDREFMHEVTFVSSSGEIVGAVLWDDASTTHVFLPRPESANNVTAIR